MKFNQTVPPPAYQNSAGRLLMLLEMMGPGKNAMQHLPSHFHFESPEEANKPESRVRAYSTFMDFVGSAFDEFVADVAATNRIPPETKMLLNEGMARLANVVFHDPNTKQPTLQAAEIAWLKMAATLLDQEQVLEKDDKKAVRDAIDALQETLQESEISKSARVAMLEVVRLARNSLDQYTIHGARGFKDAFKRMLSELMEVFLADGQDVTQKPFWDRALNLAQTVDRVGAKLLKYTPLMENVRRLLGG